MISALIKDDQRTNYELVRTISSLTYLLAYVLTKNKTTLPSSRNKLQLQQPHTFSKADPFLERVPYRFGFTSSGAEIQRKISILLSNYIS
jgi:hypothetical protein